MSITKETELLEITVASSGVVYYEQANKIIEDGVEISRAHHRTVLNPGQDLTDQPANVVAICNVAWTQEVIDAYNAQIAAQQAPQGE